MPIHLSPPAHNSGGPDGKGWNRLSLNAHMGSNTAQCALRPRSYSKLYESQDTRKARWAGFGPCVGDGRCDENCPVFAARPKRLRSFTPDVLVRLWRRVEGMPDEAHVMNKPEQGWGSSSQRWDWDDLARLQGWRLGDRLCDEHGEGFWLHATDEPTNGIYG